MKQNILLTILFCLSSLVIQAQEQLEDLSYASESIIEKNIGLPIVRPIYGGTKIQPEFEGDWPYEIKGAFEYACKIWEEAIPTTFPIKIKVILDNKSTQYANKSVYSKIQIKTTEFSTFRPDAYYTNLAPWTQIKAKVWLCKSGIYDTGDVTPLTINIFNEPEIIIRYYNYNNKLSNECSFSLTENIDNNHYDFITMALRDIGKSLGLMCRFKANKNSESLNIPQKTIPFEENILKTVGSDPQMAYTKATSGKVNVGDYMNPWALYAPSNWDSERSLNYFIPKTSQKITELMSYDFGKGTVVRDISCYDTRNIFKELLNWKGDIAVGITSGGTSATEKETSTSCLFPFQGVLTPKKQNARAYATKSILTTEELEEYMNQFIPTSIQDFIGLQVSLLKNDGTWDNVLRIPGEDVDIDEINVKDFELHYDISSYARSCDGYIRCRVMRIIYNFSKMKEDYYEYYYLLDYLPQIVQLSRSAIVPSIEPDEYLRDVKIGLKNLEGVTKIVVSQLDEGNEMPYQYEVEDFQKGYFVATVDKDYSTTFTITAYNKNGSTESYPYVLPPVDPSPIDVEFQYKNNAIKISASKRNAKNTNLISNISISSLTDKYNSIKTISSNNDKEINISSLQKGKYAITVYDINNKKHTFKFTK